VVELDRRRQILEAALKVFAEEGFAGATIKGIAREAGIRSPALIYWYFEGKEAVLRAVVEERLPVVRLAAHPEELAHRPPEEVLPVLARGYLESFEDPQTARMFQLLISEAVRSPELAERFYESGPLHVFRFLVSYLERQVELGRLREHDPQSAVRAFMGPLIAYLFSRHVFPPLRAGLPERDRYVEEVVGIFLDGLRAEER
jgi:AcrR family transcriptional regulator